MRRPPDDKLGTVMLMVKSCAIEGGTLWQLRHVADSHIKNHNHVITNKLPCQSLHFVAVPRPCVNKLHQFGSCRFGTGSCINSRTSDLRLSSQFESGDVLNRFRTFDAVPPFLPPHHYRLSRIQLSFWAIAKQNVRSQEPFRGHCPQGNLRRAHL